MEYVEKKKVNIASISLYLGIVLVFVVFEMVCILCGKKFITINNIFNIITQSSITSIIAIGASLVIITGGIDLSVGSIVGFVGILGGLLIKNQTPLFASVLLCIIAGALLGLANGILVSYGKVPSFIVTLGTMQAVRGLALLINGGQPVSAFPPGLEKIMCTKLFSAIPIAIVYVLISYALMVFVMGSTRFGRYVYAFGGNKNAARLSGVATKRIELFVYILCGIFAAIGGVMLLSRLTYADPNAGSGYEMNAIAATVIGGISLSGGRGKLINTLIGAILLSTLTSGLQILNVATYYQSIVVGVVIVAAVFADKQKERKSE
ncbi:ABC transporter permease [Treponema parvum]|uniref:ABC transporter permease n=1 Tax=Treponema parvum TaxID=138851 RepID=A0A975F400_9SPIR|nr:ABC transporter permease [Treponema parvum]QTQ13986.1 ABC transporter permease [Treponema parvum]